MEGVLWKWTNYWTGVKELWFLHKLVSLLHAQLFFLGWQPRWFILDESGVLVYYKSQEEVHQGCKGSLKISACEISGKIYFYFKIAIGIDDLFFDSAPC
jgi:pleckstrin family protein A (phosphoinositide binding specific) protein 8